MKLHKSEKDQLLVKITLQGEQYALGSTQYTVDYGANILMGKATITDEDKKKLLEMDMGVALNQVAKELADDLAKFIKKTYAAEIKEATQAFVKENKDSLLKKVMSEVAKDAEAALERLYQDDRW